MSKRIDLLLNKNKNRQPRRIGDIGEGAPYCHLFSNKESVMLSMPNTISTRNQIIWDQKDFTADSIRGAAFLGGLKESGISYATALKTGVGYLEGVKKDVQSKLGSGLGGVDGLGDYFLHKDKMAVNPNKEMTFNGIGYRTFTFEFELIPLNARDAKAIEEFIYFFQTNAMPDYADSDTTYFAYPHSWDITFPKTKWLPKIMPCYLTDYSIAYGGVGKMVAHVDSSVQTNISLTFTEADLHTRSRVKDGYRG